MNLTMFKSKPAAIFLAMFASMFALPAMAAGESTAIIAAFNEYKVEVVLIVVAFAVVLWVIRGVGLLKPKG